MRRRQKHELRSAFINQDQRRRLYSNKRSLNSQNERLPCGSIIERISAQREIARERSEDYGNPESALKALTNSQATFSEQDIVKFLHTRTERVQKFQAALLEVKASPELVALGRDDRNVERFTSREMLALEAKLLQDAHNLAQRPAHVVAASRAASVRHSISYPRSIWRRSANWRVEGI